MTKPLLIGREHNKHTFHNLSLVRLSGRVSGLAGLLGEYPLQLERIGKQLVAFVHGKLHHTPTHMRATVMNCSHISLAFHAKSWRRGCLWPGRVNIYSLLMLMFAMLSAPSKYLPCNIPCCNESSDHWDWKRQASLPNVCSRAGGATSTRLNKPWHFCLQTDTLLKSMCCNLFGVPLSSMQFKVRRAHLWWKYAL